MPSRVRRAWAWKPSTMSAQASGGLGGGTEPPPDSKDPSRQVATSEGSPLTAPRSAWVICPTFSSRVISASSSSARAAGLREASSHGRSGAAGPGAGGARRGQGAREGGPPPGRGGRGGAGGRDGRQGKGDQETGADGAETDWPERSPHDGSSRPRPPWEQKGRNGTMRIGYRTEPVPGTWSRSSA